MSSSKVFQQNEIHSLYNDHHNWLYNWLLHKLGNSYDAADLAHDTFIRLIVSQQRTHTLGDNPRAFLTCIAKGLVIDHWRRQEIRKAYQETVASLQTHCTPSPEIQLSTLEALYQIDEMLQNLPARTRKIFFMAQLEGLTYRQISERNAISVATVKWHMRKAFIVCASLI
ncbi:RNA polymerase sigma-70 factor, ECF subfamily [Nitrosomonas marina]|uniref:RNA polymerase sigma-70 factor, ECF subfamily n=1 Tax=Nitrosomonas marina TaxID=917 RepID=A0A1H9YMX7_9PROT|nr:sigma-70 family RNA polymerase sigma factor [Nitrosomonas marina]SES70388.1 RNA polymerase sigma-70 factor, ECF subfamily [Nitrosomonas marina]